LRDFGFTAASVLTLTPELPGERLFRLIDSHVPGAADAPRLMAGAEARAAQGARRTLPPAEEPDPELTQALKDKRQLQILVENADKGLAQPEQVLGQLKPVLNKLSHEQGAAAAFSLANQLARSGRWLLAQEVFLTMVDQFPAHPLTAHAYRWLIQHNTSSEAQRRYEMTQYMRASANSVLPPQVPSPVQIKKIMEEQKQKQAHVAAGTDSPDTPQPLPADLTGVDWQKYYKGSQPISQPLLGQPQFAYLANQGDLAHWYKQSLEFAERLKKFGPLLGEDPAVQFCLQAARRNAGDFKSPHEFYRDYKSRPNPGPWQQAAALEYWLSAPDGPPPRPVLPCRPAVSRPYLDGDFSDPCWQAVEPVVLTEAVGKTGQHYRTEVRLAYDQEFLYVALSCTHPPEYHVPPAKSRARDEDLRSYDRVSLMLDLDRDYSTYYHFQVDQRGCVSEDCWGDKSWNPKWFVAVRSNQTSWNIEAAIPLIQLTGRPITATTTWACNVVRVLPGRGVQAMSLPADVQPRPEGMGLLMFQTAPAAPAVQPAAHKAPAGS
jgi:hypothetical protein